MTSDQIANLLGKLQKLNLKPYFNKNNEYFDEPKFYSYGGRLNLTREHTDGFILKDTSVGSGTSFFSAETALSNSIFETMERFCSCCYKTKNLKWTNFASNPKLFIDPTLFSSDKDIKNKKMYWAKGINLKSGKKCFLPAQLAYLSYRWQKDEPRLDFSNNSNGSASGETITHAILNGIYESVERDAFMSVYLAQISPPKVNLERVNDDKIRNIVKKIIRYRLELHVLDVTTDINIPSYFAILIDKTGLGPAVSVGAKASLSSKKAVIGAVTEALMCRLYVKEMLQNGKIAPDLAEGKNVFADRARYWVHSDSLKDIEFLVKGKLVLPKITDQKISMEKELSIAKEKVFNAGFNMYFVDYSFPAFGKNFIAGKVIIPGFQSMYLDERDKNLSINDVRLKRVASLYNTTFKGVNSYPHPFL